MKGEVEEEGSIAVTSSIGVVVERRLVKKVVLVTLAGLVFLAFTAAVASAAIYVPDDYETIQQAVDNATAGDTIIVRDGAYNENVLVGTRLTLKSENGTTDCIVNASNPGGNAFWVYVNYVNISGFTVQNATESTIPGIYLWSVSHCNISGNNATNNDIGIYLYKSSYNKVTNNIADSNTYGIYLYDSSNNNTVANNTANSNNVYGIYIYDSSNNNTLVNNTANSNDEAGIYMSNSNDNNITDNTASQTDLGYGIYMSNANNNKLTNNNASHNNGGSLSYGIYLTSSSDNTFSNNTANSNPCSGIWLNSSSNNNTFINNTVSSNNYTDFYSTSDSRNNTVEELFISSYPTTVSFIYGNGVELKGVKTAPDDPSDKVNISKYVNATNVTADSWLFLNVNYNESDLGDVAEDTLRLWRHNGSDWAVVTGTNGVNTTGKYVYANITGFSVFAPLGDAATYIPPTPINMANETGSYWVNYTWAANVTAGNNVTDAYNVSNGTSWVNGTNTWYNETVGPSGWLNISVWAYNVSGGGTLSVGSVSDEVQAPAAPAGGTPDITSFAPESPVNDTYCTWRKFNVTVNQTVNVTWYLNGTAQTPKNESVTDAEYTLHAEYTGENNVTAVAENANGKVKQEWLWNVTEATIALEVNKTVRDLKTGNWEKVILANASDELQFRIWVHNNGTGDLTNITVNDTLSAGLEYVTGSATVNGVPCEPPGLGVWANSLVWYYDAGNSCTDPFKNLSCGQNITIEFNATKNQTGDDTNCVNVSAWFNETEPDVHVFDEGCVSVLSYGAVHLVVRGTDNGVWYINRNASGNWTGWELVQSGYTTDSPALTSTDGSVHVAVRGTDSGVWYINRDVSGNWTGWELVQSGYTTDAPALTSTTGGAVHVAVRGVDDGVWYNNRNASGNWTGWELIQNGYTTDAPALTSTTCDAVHVAVRGLDGGVWYNNRNASGNWSGWELVQNGYTLNAPALTSTGDEVHVAVRGVDDGAWYNNRTTSGNWSGWKLIQSGYTTDAPALTSTTCDAVHVAVRGLDGGVWYNNRNATTGNWSSWELAQAGYTLDTPALTSTADGAVHVTVRGVDDGVWYNNRNGNWNGWELVQYGYTYSSPAVTS